MAELVNRFSGGKFWGTRLASIVATVLVLLILQYIADPKSHLLNGYDTRLITLALIFATLAVSLNIINGITGQFSMGHAAFYMVGAYTSGKLTATYFDHQTLPDWLWLLLVTLAGGIGAAIAGFIVGLPSLRLKGDYLAIVTLGFGEIARIVVQNQDGGNQAIAGLDLGGAYRLAVKHQLTEVAYVGLLLIITMAIARNLLKTAHGLTFLSVREDELAASAVGVNTTRTKVTAFIIGAFLAGAAGALYAHYNKAISPDDFKMDVSFLVVTMVVIGGTGSITGAAIAGIALKLFEEALRTFSSIPAIELMSYVFALIIVMFFTTKALRPMKDQRAKKFEMAFTMLGYIGALGLAYLAYRNWTSTVSPVIKFAFIAICVSAIVSFLFTSARAGLPRFGFFILAAAFVFLLKFPVAMALHAFPLVEKNLAATTYTPSDLRWAVFAVTLIVVMLVRPSGILGHHEFSWDFVKHMFGKPHNDQAVAA